MARIKKSAKNRLADFLHEVECPVCGKHFIPAPYHVYKIYRGRRFCSYTCFLKAKEIEKEKKVYKKDTKRRVWSN